MDGVLIVDKPEGLTSHDVVARVRRILRVRRVGHTGTLDPFATGVLVLLLGRATRLAQFLNGAEKEYEATIRFGYATDTGDIQGQPQSAVQIAPDWDPDQIEAALSTLRGEILQTPPMFSAKKVKGEKLYEMARRGEIIAREPVAVNVPLFEAVKQNGELLRRNEDGTTHLTVRVVCSAGTYVRTLAESLGQMLGVGAHLAQLRRTRAGQFKIENSLHLAELEQKAEAGTALHSLVSPDAALSQLPFASFDRVEAQKASNGMSVRVTTQPVNEWPDGQQVRMRDEDGDLFAVGFYDAAGQLLHPRIVIAPANEAGE
ncbi:MAG: tRNA pseudouridine(55) synthase TruB [Pyrinomonadaceae bacterium]